MKFKNTTNDYIENSPAPWFWVLCFSWMYYAYKGAWGAAGIYLALFFITFGISWFFMPFFAKKWLRKSYLKKGWVEL